jgi:hypothetical protein
MYVTVIHSINDAASFQTRGQQLLPSPAGVAALQFFPDTEGKRAVCLWQADSVDAVRDHIDGTLGDAAAQEYYAVSEQHAVGLPAAQLA